jgi:predicted dehydrogenase
MHTIAVVGPPEEVARRCRAWRAVRHANAVAAPEGLTGDSGSGVPWPADADAVYVASPIDRRGELGIAAARAGKHVLIELPLAPTLEGAERLIAAAREAGVGLVPVAVLRCQPFALALREAIEAGKLGPLRFAHVTMVRGVASGDIAAPDLGGRERFSFQEASDALDLLAWLFATPIRTVFARACLIGGDSAVSDYLSVVVTFAAGGQAVCEAGRTSAVGTGGLVRISVTGKRGSAYHDGQRRDVILGPAGARPLADDPLVHLVELLDRWALDPVGWPDSVESARRSLALVLAAEASLERGEPVALAGAW